MKIIFSLSFFFLVVFSFGQTITVKEYDYETATFGGAITTKTIVPGDTITLGITILETSKNDPDRADLASLSSSLISDSVAIRAPYQRTKLYQHLT
jgi:hypothetical protein